MSIHTWMVGSDDLFVWVLAGGQQDGLVPSCQADLTGLWRRGGWYSSKPRNQPSPGRDTHIDLSTIVKLQGKSHEWGKAPSEACNQQRRACESVPDRPHEDVSCSRAGAKERRASHPGQGGEAAHAALLGTLNIGYRHILAHKAALWVLEVPPKCYQGACYTATASHIELVQVCMRQ